MQHTKLVSEKKNASSRRSCCPYLHGPEIIHIQYWGHSQTQVLRTLLSLCHTPCLAEPGGGKGTHRNLQFCLWHTPRTKLLSQAAQPRADRYSELSWAEFTEHSSAWHCPLSGFILLSPLSGTSRSCREFPLAAAGEKFLLPSTLRSKGQIGWVSQLKKETALGADGRQQRVVLETIFQGNLIQKSQFHTAFKQDPSYLKSP